MIYTKFNKPPGNHKWIIGLNSMSAYGQLLHRYCDCGFQLYWAYNIGMGGYSWLWKFGNKDIWKHYYEEQMSSSIISEKCLAYAMNEALI